MSSRQDYQIKWLGFNKAPNYNQIWGYVFMSDERMFSFWGARGGRILFKKHSRGSQLSWLIKHKEEKGFKKIDPDHYEMICAGFRGDFEIWLTAAFLADEY